MGSVVLQYFNNSNNSNNSNSSNNNSKGNQTHWCRSDEKPTSTLLQRSAMLLLIDRCGWRCQLMSRWHWSSHRLIDSGVAKIDAIGICHAPKAQLRIRLKDELDRLFPTEIKRQEKRCLIHVANLAEDYIIRQLPLLMPFLKKIAPLLSKPKNASTDSLYNL